MKPGRKPGDQKDGKGRWSPTEEQEECARLLFHTGKTNKEIIADLKISEPTFYNWFKDEDFLAYIELKRSATMASRMPRIDNSLVEKALGDDTNAIAAIRTIYEKRGEINTKDKDRSVAIQINLVSPIKLGNDVIGQIEEAVNRLPEENNGGNGNGGNGNGNGH